MWLPIDDENTITFSVRFPDGPYSDEDRAAMAMGLFFAPEVAPHLAALPI